MTFAALLLAATLVSAEMPGTARWESTWFPVGNGSLGAMIDGGTETLTLQLNVDSLWTGGRTVNEPEARREKEFGDYQNLGYLRIRIPRPGIESDYRRELDLETAEYRDRFTVSEVGDNCRAVTFARRVFASYPDALLAVRIEHSIPFERPLVATLEGTHGETVSPAGFSGTLPNGLAYRVCLDRTDEPCASTFYLRAATDFFGPLPAWKAITRSYADLRARHVADYRALYGRMTFSLAGEAAREALLFNFARYLLISSSRPGSLPANLQGIWNDSNRPTWHSDYHTNINLQMNYWGADAANLSECFEPLVDWMERTRPAYEALTRDAFPGSRGFAYRTSANPFGGGTFVWNFAGAPWLACMLYEHTRFTGDTNALRTRVYPIMRGAAEFILGRLKTRPDGSVVVSGGWSPEHGPREDGVTHDQQIARELFRAIAKVAQTLDIDDDFTRTVAEKEKHLLREKIGSWGQLQEWETDRDVRGDPHRHTSHLFAVYPGTTITAKETPDLFAAARVALEGRALTGDSRRSWTWPWRASLWARLGEPDRAEEMIDALLKYNTYPNLLTSHPPFQIDGNLGVLGAFAEIFRVIKETGRIPKRWSQGGSVTGFRLPDAAPIDLAW